ncbi:MAG: ParB N-terminal domain-containing protein [Polyangiaceae bacterium]|nr:ParB N-terminal domain-containing protein [Polyangiaceae bacterium]
MTAPRIITLPIAAIRRDFATQPRALVWPEMVARYAMALATGATLPPVDVVYDGAEYWLVDGYHRVAAHEARGHTTVAVRGHQGTRRDAILFAAGANATHGLRRGRRDAQRAVRLLLRDPAWSLWSDREIAEVARVSRACVARVRRAELQRQDLPHSVAPTSTRPALARTESERGRRPQKPKGRTR